MESDARPSGRMLVARVTKAWYVLCASRELRDKPVARRIFGTPVVVFRGEGGAPGVLLDRCPHRNVPLSLGRRRGDRLQCRYHGWQFDAGGRCRGVPGLAGDPDKDARACPSFAAREQDGFVWAYAAGGAPEGEPFRLPEVDPDRYTVVRRVVDAEGPLHATVENALDVPHTAFLHKGLFRGTGKTNKIKVVVTRTATGVQAEYIGEPRPEGVAAKILSPSGGTVTHFDRFFLPSIAQVDYRIGEENHFLVTSIATPVEDFHTRMHAVIQFRTRFPGWLVKLILQPVGMRIFKQDAEILKIQADAIRRFAGEHYASTEIDVLGLQIWRLLRRAELGRIGADASEGERRWRREIEMEA